LPSEKSIDTAQIVPRDWKLEPLDPNRNGQRFVSPDGTAWFDGDRIFYRQAFLACAGDRWHHIAFEYPSNAKGNMTDFVRRASDAL
jgi:hypothetical protein